MCVCVCVCVCDNKLPQQGFAFQFQDISWSSRSPVIYQHFENLHLRKVFQLPPNVPSHICLVTDCCMFHVFHKSLKQEWLHMEMYPFQYPAQISTMFPSTTEAASQCGVMVLNNLMTPDWIFVDCALKLITDTFCSMHSHSKEFDQISVSPHSQYCPIGLIFYENKCLAVLWNEGLYSLSGKCSAMCQTMTPLVFHNEKAAEAFFEEVTLTLTSALLMIKAPNFKVFHYTYDYTHSKYQEQTNVSTSISNMSESHTGLQMCNSPTMLKTIGDNLFQCKPGTYISFLLVLDGTKDCSTNEDEEFLSENKLNIEDRFLIVSYVCDLWHHRSPHGSCQKYSNLKNIDASQSIGEMFQCKGGKSISGIQVDDLYGDCGSEAEDEAVLLSLLMNGTQHSCPQHDEIPCRFGHPKCYKIYEHCNYKKDKNNHLLPCRNGGHLQSCRKFKCNMKFKCSIYYCIPFNYQCDGKWDCPQGEDESEFCTDTTRCANMFRCRSPSQICIHLGQVCDKVEDCSLTDDEDLCELDTTNCAQSCVCLALAVVCVNTNLNHLKYTYPYLALSVFSTEISLQHFLKTFVNVMHLKLTNVFLSELCTQWPKSVLSLSVTFHNFQNLKSKCFSDQNSLQTILIQENKIISLKSETFDQLPHLKMVNMSRNEITELPKNLFGKTSNLLIFSILKNPLNFIHPHTFLDVFLTKIETTNFHMTCVVPSETIINTETPWYFQCSDLLPTQGPKSVFIVFTCLILSISLFCFFYHLVKNHSTKGYKTYVCSANIGDFVCVVYLCLVWISDVVHANTFCVYEQIWRSSFGCFTAFCLIFLFHIVSPSVLFLLALTRRQLVAHPIDSKFKQTSYVYKCLTATVILCVSLSMTVTLLAAMTSAAVPNVLCLPFVDHSHTAIHIYVLTGFTTLTQSLVAVLISAIHVSLVMQKKKSSSHVQQESHQSSSSNTQLVIQLITISSLNFISWFPSNIVYIVAHCLSQYPTEMVLWPVAVVTPLNPLVNASIFVFTAIRASLKDTKVYQSLQ